MYLSLLCYCWWPGASQLPLIIEIKIVSFAAGLILMPRAIPLLLLIQIKSVSFAAGLLLMARGYSTLTSNSDKKCIFSCWPMSDD